MVAFKYTKGKTMYSLAHDTWDKREVAALQRVMDSGRYTMGPEVAKFEKEFADYIGAKFAVMTNSGSSANLIALTSIVQNPNYDLNPGDEVIVPAVSWSTTFFPVQQNGLVLKFVDIDKDSLNIDPDLVEQAITEKTKAVFAVNLLGNSCELSKLKNICNRHNIVLLEDNCESFGAKHVNKYCSTWGDAGTFSFFFSHHLQTMEGGMIVTDDADLADYMRSLRAHGWVRDIGDNSSLYTKSGDPFEDSFRFVLPGYCVRPLEMSGAVGQVQLGKADSMVYRRIENSKVYHSLFNEVDYARTQLPTEDSVHTYFGFSFVLENNLKDRRSEVINLFKENNIECRPIVAGNFMRNPVIDRLNYTTFGTYSCADEIHDQGFFLGNDNRNLETQLEKVKELMETL